MATITNFSTIAEMFLGVTDAFRGKQKDAFRRKVDGVYIGTSYDELFRQVEAFALSLRGLGLSRGDKIGIMSENRLEWVIADFACALTGIVDVPVFPILTPKQIEYIYNDAEVKGVICSNALQLRKLMKVVDSIDSIEHIIVMQDDAVLREPRAEQKQVILFRRMIEEGKLLAETLPGEIRNIAAQVTSDDLLTLIYTSGTTGNPRGVMLTHGNFASNVTSVAQAFGVFAEDIVLSYLPLCHAYERTAGYYTCFACGATIAFADSIETVSENLTEVRPTIITSVPRLFERIKNRVEKSVATGPEKKRKIFAWAIRVGIQRFRREARGRGVGLVLGIKDAIAEKLVFEKVRAHTGGRIRLFVSGGAALPPDVAEFFFALRLTIIEGYGLTEASPIISANPLERPRIGTVGKPIPGIEVSIASDGEILTRGEHVMKGYLHNPAATAEAIDPDGWLHTGDIGLFDKYGYLKITDRKKHIFISSGGKNIAPSPIENLLLESSLIDQIVLVGDNRPFVTALIVPSLDTLNEIAEMGGPGGAAAAGVRMAIEADIKRLQRDLSNFERVRRFELLTEAFTVENGLLTPTLKVKRKDVLVRYEKAIEKMYEGVDME